MIVRDFETGDLSKWRVNGGAPTITQEQVHSGGYAMRTYEKRGGNGHASGGTEVVLTKDGGGRVEMPYPSEFWMGFSVFVPDDWEPDKPTLRETVFQAHAKPYYKDGGPKQPPFALGFRGDTWDIVSRGGKTLQWNPSLTIDRWTDWVCHFKLSGGSDGLIQIFQDGVLVAGKSGNNRMQGEDHAADLVYFKFGLYKWTWKPKHDGEYPSPITERLYYHDDIRMGNSYEDVAPPGSPPNPIPPPPEPPPPVPVPDPDPPDPDPVDEAQDDRLDAIEDRLDTIEKWTRGLP